MLFKERGVMLTSSNQVHEDGNGIYTIHLLRYSEKDTTTHKLDEETFKEMWKLLYERDEENKKLKSYTKGRPNDNFISDVLSKTTPEDRLRGYLEKKRKYVNTTQKNIFAACYIPPLPDKDDACLLLLPKESAAVVLNFMETSELTESTELESVFQVKDKFLDPKSIRSYIFLPSIKSYTSSTKKKGIQNLDISDKANIDILNRNIVEKKDKTTQQMYESTTVSEERTEDIDANGTSEIESIEKETTTSKRSEERAEDIDANGTSEIESIEKETTTSKRSEERTEDIDANGTSEIESIEKETTTSKTIRGFKQTESQIENIFDDETPLSNAFADPEFSVTYQAKTGGDLVEISLINRNLSLITKNKRKQTNRIDIESIKEVHFLRGEVKSERSQTYTRDEMSENKFYELIKKMITDPTRINKPYMEIVEAINEAKKKGVIAIEEGVNKIKIRGEKPYIEKEGEPDSWSFYSYPGSKLIKKDMETIFKDMFKGEQNKTIHILGNSPSTETLGFQIRGLRFSAFFAWKKDGQKKVKTLYEKYKEIKYVDNRLQTIMALNMIELVMKELEDKNVHNDNIGIRTKYFLSSLKEQCISYLKKESYGNPKKEKIEYKKIKIRTGAGKKLTEEKIVERIVNQVLKYLREEKDALAYIFHYQGKNEGLMHVQRHTDIREQIKEKIRHGIKKNREKKKTSKERIKIDNPKIIVEIAENEFFLIVEDILREKRKKIYETIDKELDNSPGTTDKKIQNSLKAMISENDLFAENGDNFKSFCSIISKMLGLINLEINRHVIRKGIRQDFKEIDPKKTKSKLEVDVFQPYMSYFLEEKFPREVTEESLLSGGKVDFKVQRIPIELKAYYDGKQNSSTYKKESAIYLLNRKSETKQILEYSLKTRLGIIIAYDYRLENVEDIKDISSAITDMVSFKLEGKDDGVLLCFIVIPGNRQKPSTFGHD